MCDYCTFNITALSMLRNLYRSKESYDFSKSQYPEESRHNGRKKVCRTRMILKPMYNFDLLVALDG